MTRPGDRSSKLRALRLSDHMPDRRRGSIPDLLARHRYWQDSMSSQHTTLTVGNTVTQTTDEQLRIKNVQVGTVTGGTVTVQVQVEGRDIFTDASRPVSGGAVMEPTDIYTFPAGTPIATIIEASSGVPAGAANIVIATEPFELLPRSDLVELQGKDRLKMSSRRLAQQANKCRNLAEITVAQRGRGVERAEGPTPQERRRIFQRTAEIRRRLEQEEEKRR